MGAAAYGKNNIYYKKIQNLINLKNDGSFDLNYLIFIIFISRIFITINY